MIRTTELSYASLELNKLEAFLEVMFLAAHADGDIDDRERSVFRDHVAAETQGQLDTSLIDMMLAQIETNLSRYPRKERLESIRERLPEPRLRRAALEIAARIIHADGKVVGAEIEFYDSAAAALDIPLSIAKTILEAAPASE